MSRPVPQYAQDPKVPHPGTVKFIDLWNHSEKIKPADDVPDNMKFFCMDANRFEVSREQAAWCIPIVEYVTLSLDQHGKPVEPRVADFIRITSYGPNHSYIGSTVTPPNFRKPPAAAPQSAPPQPDPPSRSPHGLRDGFAGEGAIAEQRERVEGISSAALPRLTWWQRVRRVLFG